MKMLLYLLGAAAFIPMLVLPLVKLITKKQLTWLWIAGYLFFAFTIVGYINSLGEGTGSPALIFGVFGVWWGLFYFISRTIGNNHDYSDYDLPSKEEKLREAVWHAEQNFEYEKKHGTKSNAEFEKDKLRDAENKLWDYTHNNF